MRDAAAIAKETLGLFGGFVAIGGMSSLLRKALFSLLAVKHPQLRQKTRFQTILSQTGAFPSKHRK